MTTDYPPGEAPATPEYVLAVLRDWYALLLDADQVQPGLRIATDETVERFADQVADPNWGSCDWRTVAAALNEMWAVTIPERDWQTVLTPPRDRTLGDVARFLCGRVRRQGIRPWRHVGGDCLPAGAFLTARAMFVRAGADGETITPSSSLQPLLTRFYNDLSWEMPRLAPGRLPPLGVRPYYRYGNGCGLVGVLLFIAGLGAGPWVAGLGVGPWPSYSFLSLGLGLIATGLVASRSVRAEWPGLVTFRDLAYALAGQDPRRRIQPTP